MTRARQGYTSVAGADSATWWCLWRHLALLLQYNCTRDACSEFGDGVHRA